VAAPGEFGGDVSHLNLHKTFCIPHGGGGPGVGPVCVVEDLVPFLPGHATALQQGAYAAAPGRPKQGAAPSGLSAAAPGLPAQDWTARRDADSGSVSSSEPHAVGSVGAVSSAPLGNAAVLPISWMYIRMMGADGLRHATEAAILSANYISKRLKDHYPTLYASANGHVAHECILDLRGLKDTSGVMAEDVAKRLMDYGFHAPTLSFPVANTLMVEPTESETLEELDRFIDAMIAIREEIRLIEAAIWPRDDNPLKNAPHTAASVLKTEWPHPYPRDVAAAARGAAVNTKYWPSVGRVDNVYGDRNLFCSCVPVSDAD
jgi:glycine dehydrogenase